MSRLLFAFLLTLFASSSLGGRARTSWTTGTSYRTVGTSSFILYLPLLTLFLPFLRLTLLTMLTYIRTITFRRRPITISIRRRTPTTFTMLLFPTSAFLGPFSVLTFPFLIALYRPTSTPMFFLRFSFRLRRTFGRSSTFFVFVYLSFIFSFTTIFFT